MWNSRPRLCGIQAVAPLRKKALCPDADSAFTSPATSARSEWLRAQGAEVEVVETGTCCGMAGTFGMKAGALGYELSQAVGEPLFKQFKDSGVAEAVTESSVCRMQIQEGTGLKVWHPLELLMEK